MRSLLILLVIVLTGTIFSYNNHVVNTNIGLRVYAKAASGFEQTYVDVRPFDICHVGPYKNVVIAMMAAGDHGLITGGNYIKMAMDATQIIGSSNDAAFRSIEAACGLSKTAGNVAQRLRENPTINHAVNTTRQKLGEFAEKFRGRR